MSDEALIDFIVNENKRIGVQATDSRDAIKRILAGEGEEISTSFGANPRPATPTPPQIRPNQ